MRTTEVKLGNKYAFLKHAGIGSVLRSESKINVKAGSEYFHFGSTTLVQAVLRMWIWNFPHQFRIQVYDIRR